METSKDPEFLAALRTIFATRDDLKMVVEYQQRLYASLQALNASHRAVHQHVRSLTESHNTVRLDANALIRHRNELVSALNNLTEAHARTRDDIRRSIDAISYIQQQAAKIPELEMRIRLLEQELASRRHGGQDHTMRQG